MSPNEILHHMCNVIHSSRFYIEQESLPKETIDKLSFENEIERFNTELSKIDRLLDKKSLDINHSKRLVQGPFSDLLTHV